MTENNPSYPILTPQHCAYLLLCTETGLCRLHLLSDKCAGNPLWSAPVCYKWADTLRDSAKAKKFTISSDACAVDREMRMTPPQCYLPVTHTHYTSMTHSHIKRYVNVLDPKLLAEAQSIKKNKTHVDN